VLIYFFDYCRDGDHVELLAVLRIYNYIIVKYVRAIHALLAQREIYWRARVDKQQLVFLVATNSDEPAGSRSGHYVHPYLAYWVHRIAVHLVHKNVKAEWVTCRVLSHLVDAIVHYDVYFLDGVAISCYPLFSGLDDAA